MVTKVFSARNSISAAEKNGPVPLKASEMGTGLMPLTFGFKAAVEGGELGGTLLCCNELKESIVQRQLQGYAASAVPFGCGQVTTANCKLFWETIKPEHHNADRLDCFILIFLSVPY